MWLYEIIIKYVLLKKNIAILLYYNSRCKIIKILFLVSRYVRLLEFINNEILKIHIASVYHEIITKVKNFEHVCLYKF